MTALKTLLRKAVPVGIRDWMHYLRTPASRDAIRRGRAGKRIARAASAAGGALWKAAAGKVATGPFVGMHYILQATGSMWAPKVLGIYEKELWPTIETIIAKRYEIVIDIGAAEGYYAVGLAVRIPHARMIAFEAQIHVHDWLRSLAVANGVAERVEIRGLCSPESLIAVVQDAKKTLVICDAEGAEYPLLDPAAISGLTSADFLVELHHWVHSDIETVLKVRFAASHHCQTINAAPRTESDWPDEIQISAKYHSACMDELRPDGMKWLWMQNRAHRGAMPG